MLSMSMTGNPSGITNPISMTTTASTARSDMLAVSKFFDSGNKQKMPPKRLEPATAQKGGQRGFEPTIFRLEAGRLIHLATRA